MACQETTMTSTASATTSTPVTAVTSSAPATLGSSLDAELVVVKARLAVLESEAKTDWTKVKAWFGTNWPHFVSWIGTGALVADKFGVLKL